MGHDHLNLDSVVELRVFSRIWKFCRDEAVQLVRVFCCLFWIKPEGWEHEAGLLYMSQIILPKMEPLSIIFITFLHLVIGDDGLANKNINVNNVI